MMGADLRPGKRLAALGLERSLPLPLVYVRNSSVISAHTTCVPWSCWSARGGSGVEWTW